MQKSSKDMARNEECTRSQTVPVYPTNVWQRRPPFYSVLHTRSTLLLEICNYNQFCMNLFIHAAKYFAVYS